MMTTKWAAKKATPTVVCRLGYGIEINDDEYGGETNVVIDNHEYYAVEWTGTPGLSDPTVVRKPDLEIESIKKVAAVQIVSPRIVEYENEKGLEPYLFKGQLCKITSAVERTIKRAENQGLADDLPIPCNNGKWDNYDGTESKDFTVKDMKELYNAVFDRSSRNYTNMKSHVAAISAMITDETKTAQDIYDYDYSAGWNE